MSCRQVQEKLLRGGESNLPTDVAQRVTSALESFRVGLPQGLSRVDREQGSCGVFKEDTRQDTSTSRSRSRSRRKTKEQVSAQGKGHVARAITVYISKHTTKKQRNAKTKVSEEGRGRGAIWVNHQKYTLDVCRQASQHVAPPRANSQRHNP